jgi:hypothetical protein
MMGEATKFSMIIPGSRRRACTTAAPSITTIKPAVPTVTGNRGEISSTAGESIATPPVISVNPANTTVLELKSSTQLEPRSARRFLGTTAFMAPEAAKTRPIPALTTHKATFT